MRQNSNANICFSPQIVKHIIRGVLRGCEQMHRKGICHRDLKPENVLLKQGNEAKSLLDWEVKIADLGAAKVLDYS